MNFINIFCVTTFVVLWLLLGLSGWVLTFQNTKNKEWLKKVNEDNWFKRKSRFFHVIFGPLSFINGIIHSF